MDDRIVSLILTHLTSPNFASKGFGIGLWWRSLEPAPGTDRPTGRLADLAFWVANRLGAERAPVTLSAIHRAYRELWPSASAGQSLASLSAVVGYHTINMPSRFPTPDAPRTDASWMRDPLFYRTARGRYQTLTAPQIERFRRAVANDDARIFAAEYDALDVIGIPW